MKWRYAILGGTAAAAAATTVHDLVQTKHAIVRNFPVIGHARFFLERFGPELRQYVVASNDEERPFSRDQRRWVYASSKLQNNYFGFGTDNDLEHSSGNVIVHHRTFGRSYPTHGAVGQEARLPSAKGLGGRRLPAQHRGGRGLAVPPQRRRPGVPDRDRLLRLPRRPGTVRPRQAQGPGLVRTYPRPGGQAQSRREAGSRRGPAGSQGVEGDRRDA